MAIIISDSFDRPNSAVTMGNADTGQTWVPSSGVSAPNPWGITSNSAYMAIVDVPFAVNQGYVIADAGTPDSISQVTCLNANATGGLGLLSQGLIFRWFDDQWYWFLGYDQVLDRFRLMESRAGLLGTSDSTNSGEFPFSNGDILKVVCCGESIKGYLNDVLILEDNGIIYPDPTVLGGTFYGLESQTSTATFDDFSVETNPACQGAEWTLPPLSWSAEAGVRRPSGGVLTQRFDAGNGNTYYLIPQLSDSGIELRDKVIKAVRITGKFNAANFKLYAYGAAEGINLANLELGLNSKTGAVAIPDSTKVVQTRRFQVNVPRAALHTIRIEGTWEGDGIKDRIDEIEYEIAEQGVRR